VNTLEIPTDVLETNSDVVGTLSDSHQITSDHTLSNFEHSEFVTVNSKKKSSVQGEVAESFFELPGIGSSGPSDVQQAAMGLNYSLSQSQPSVEEDADLGSILDGTSASDRLTSRRSNLKRHVPYDVQDGPQSKRKKAISFDKVTVYYFPRAQGFTCVPSQGGSTLGMSSQHAHVQQFSILEHAVEQRRLHRQVSRKFSILNNYTLWGTRKICAVKVQIFSQCFAWDNENNKNLRIKVTRFKESKADYSEVHQIN
jgi:cysteine/serine-rich nuclear protein